MRALQRDNEIIPEPWDQWTVEHLEWLTTPRPDGDGYVIVEDYQPETDDSDMTEPIPEAPAEEQAQDDPVPEAPAEAPEEAPAEDSGEAPAEDPEETGEPETEAHPDDDEIVVLNGVQYTKAQLRALLEGGQ